MSHSIEHYHERIRINQGDLAGENLIQVEYTAKIMREAATLRWEAEREKARLDETEALVRQRIVATAAEEKKKLTVDDVKSRVVTNEDVRAQRLSYIDAKEAHDQWATLADCWKQRGYALRELVEIANQERTSDPATIAAARRR